MRSIPPISKFHTLLHNGATKIREIANFHSHNDFTIFSWDNLDNFSVWKLSTNFPVTKSNLTFFLETVWNKRHFLSTYKRLVFNQQKIGQQLSRRCSLFQSGSYFGSLTVFLRVLIPWNWLVVNNKINYEFKKSLAPFVISKFHTLSHENFSLFDAVQGQVKYSWKCLKMSEPKYF